MKKIILGMILLLLIGNLLGTATSFKVQAVQAIIPIQPIIDKNEQLFQASRSRSRIEAGDLINEDFVEDGLAEESWSFTEVSRWHDFAAVDSDSAEIVIGLEDFRSNNYDELNRIITTYGGSIVNTVSIKEKLKATVVDLPVTSVSSFVKAMKSRGVAEYVEPNFRYQTQFVPNDANWTNQWGPQKIEADWAWNTTTGDHSIIVAIVDTGIDWNHPDLAANYVALGYDWVNMDSDPMDDNGHGTHCAGIIAAVINNSVGIAGLAQVKIMAEKGLNTGGSGTDANLANAIIHAVDSGANIISMSWGGILSSALLHEAIRYAYESDVLLIAAAGNDASSYKSYPAVFEEVVAVTATDQNDKPAWFTNFGEWVELAAPGVEIFSTVWDNTYATMSGTSMACPHVSGVAALVLSRFSDVSRDWLKLHLQYTADDLGDPGFDVYYGYGRINVRKALEVTPLEHDLCLSDLRLPASLDLGATAAVNATVTNTGNNVETNFQVKIFIEGTLHETFPVNSLTNGSSTTLSTLWTPNVWGLHNVTAHVIPVDGETTVENNAASKQGYVGIGSIYIKADGSVDPSWVPIQRSGDAYYLSDNVYAQIVVEKDNIVLSGSAHTLLGDGTGYGIQLFKRTNVTVENMHIDSFETGIMLDSSSRINISSNCITSNFLYGVWANSSSNNILTGNNISFNIVGIELDESAKNTLSKNNITTSALFALWLYGSPINIISENSIINNGGLGAFKSAVELEDSNYNSITGNRVGNSKGTGIALGRSSYNNIARNNITKNGMERGWVHWMYGIWIVFSHNNTLSENSITNNEADGIHLSHNSPDNSILGNNIANNSKGVGLEFSNNNVISTNNLTNNEANAIDLWSSDSSIILANNITNNGGYGIWFWYSQANQIFHNNFVNNTRADVYGDQSPNIWDNGYPSGGNYWSSYTGTDLFSGPNQDQPGSDGIGDTSYDIDEHSKDRYPLMNETFPTHDISVTNSTLSKSVVGKGHSLDINVTAANRGSYTENFNITLYADTTIITTFTNINLTSGRSRSITFTWNTADFAKGNYTMVAVAAPVLGETDTTNNAFTSGWAIVAMIGDITGPDGWPDGKCDIRDIAQVARRFGIDRWHPMWNPNCDITGTIIGVPDGKIDIRDLAIVAKNFGKIDP